MLSLGVFIGFFCEYNFMFSGIVEQMIKVQDVEHSDIDFRITLGRPSSFTDIKKGDSLCHDGVCLTIESFTEEIYKCSIGLETQKITQWTAKSLFNKHMNVERSLAFGDRVHGHFVSGHVDGVATLVSINEIGNSWIYTFEIPKKFSKFIWPKGSIALNGVSLTLNGVRGNSFDVCVIPETYKVTNFQNLKEAGLVNFEIDPMARAWVYNMNNFKPSVDK